MRLIITDANHFKLKQNMLWVGVMTFVTVICWIAYSIYVAYSSSTIDPEVSQYLDPLNPSLDEDMLSLITEDRFEPPAEFTILVRSEDDTGEAINQPSDLSSPPPATISSLLVVPNEPSPTPTNSLSSTP